MIRSRGSDCGGRRPGGASSCLRENASACRDGKLGAERSERGTGIRGGGGRRPVGEVSGERGGSDGKGGTFGRGKDWAAE